MKVIETSIPDLLVLEPKIWSDDRGYFFESYNEEKLRSLGIHYHWIQDNEALSSKGVLRGLHFQKGEHSQAKLVRVIKGEVLDVVVDLRNESKTFGKTFSLLLNGINKKQLLVPRGFAHGYIVLSEKAIFSYKVDNNYAPEHDSGIRYDDKQLDIDWLLPKEEIILSSKDTELPFFDASKSYF